LRGVAAEKCYAKRPAGRDITRRAGRLRGGGPCCQEDYEKKFTRHDRSSLLWNIVEGGARFELPESIGSDIATD
jgi:hypothetical protein